MNPAEPCRHVKAEMKLDDGSILVYCKKCDCRLGLYRVDPRRPKPNLTQRRGRWRRKK